MGTSASATPRWLRPIRCSTRPVASTKALIPVLVARSSQRRCSMLRTAASMRCCSCSCPAPYQESLVRFTMACARPPPWSAMIERSGERRPLVHLGEPFPARDVFAEGEELDLVVVVADLPAFVDDEGAVPQL